MRPPFGRPAFPLLAAALLAAACSPVFNWREVPIDGGAELVALLPCKPDRAERALPLGDQSVSVRMAGCEAGGATFAVAQARAADTQQAQLWLAAWRSQTQAQWAGGQIAESPGSVLHAAGSPAPLRIDASRESAKAEKQQMRLLWFAHLQRDGAVSLYQAMVLGTPSAPEAVQTFFEGLRLP
jgi:hypothetical protein